MTLHAQSSDLERAKARVYQGYISGDQSMLEEGLSSLKTIDESQEKSSLRLKYEIALAQYGLIGFYLAKGIQNGLESRLDEVISSVKRIIEANPNFAEAHALLGGLYGLKIGLNPARGIYLGPRSNRHIEKATLVNPKDPEGWVEMGNVKYHTPALLGGDISEAINCFSKAIMLFDNSPAKRKYNWLYLHACAWLGQAFEKQNKLSQALTVYRQLLRYEPDFSWVKNELLPNLEHKMK